MFLFIYLKYTPGGNSVQQIQKNNVLIPLNNNTNGDWITYAKDIRKVQRKSLNYVKSLMWFNYVKSKPQMKIVVQEFENTLEVRRIWKSSIQKNWQVKIDSLVTVSIFWCIKSLYQTNLKNFST